MTGHLQGWPRNEQVVVLQDGEEELQVKVVCLGEAVRWLRALLCFSEVLGDFKQLHLTVLDNAARS